MAEQELDPGPLAAITPAISAIARTSPFGRSPANARSRFAPACGYALGYCLTARGLLVADIDHARASCVIQMRQVVFISTLQKARHDFNQIAGRVAAIKLPADDLLPSIPAAPFEPGGRK